jgi:epoxyqueuosine reductase
MVKGVVQISGGESRNGAPPPPLTLSIPFSGSPIKRAKRKGFLRNVAVALGNGGQREAVPALACALDDPEPLIRGHAARALGQILARVGIPGDGGFEVAEELLFRLNGEEDPWVSEEISAALGS